MIEESCASSPVSIFMAGDIAKATEICRAYCDETGFCVTVTPTTYVYTDGQESGFVIGLINYPRFPSEPRSIEHRAREIAERLRVGLGQESYSIQTPQQTLWRSWRDAKAMNASGQDQNAASAVGETDLP